MGIKELIKPESQPDPLECQKVLQTLRSMRGLGDSAEPFNAVVDFGCKLMEKVLDLLQSSNMNSREWAQVCPRLPWLLLSAQRLEAVVDSFFLEHSLIAVQGLLRLLVPFFATYQRAPRPVSSAGDHLSSPTSNLLQLMRLSCPP